jgi:hypothetical protein
MEKVCVKLLRIKNNNLEREYKCAYQLSILITVGYLCKHGDFNLSLQRLGKSLMLTVIVMLIRKSPVGICAGVRLPPLVANPGHRAHSLVVGRSV